MIIIIIFILLLYYNYYNTSIRRCKTLVGLVSILIFWFCLQPTFMLYSVSKFAVNSDALRLQETGNEVLLDRHLQCCSISSVVLFTAFGIELIAVFGNKVIVVCICNAPLNFCALSDAFPHRLIDVMAHSLQFFFQRVRSVVVQHS